METSTRTRQMTRPVRRFERTRMWVPVDRIEQARPVIASAGLGPVAELNEVTGEVMVYPSCIPSLRAEMRDAGIPLSFLRAAPEPIVPPDPRPKPPPPEPPSVWEQVSSCVLTIIMVFHFPLIVIGVTVYDYVTGKDHDRPSRTYDSEYIDDFIHRPTASGRRTIGSSSGADLDCADIGEEIWVGAYDPHGLDGDGDGWGCEGW